MGKVLNAGGFPIGSLQNGPEEKLGTSNFLHIVDQKSAGTDGGTFISGSWRTRTLNTILTGSIVGASLTSNRITLPAGTYFIQAQAPALWCSFHQARLQKISPEFETLIVGTPSTSPIIFGSVSFSELTKTVVLAEQSVLELQHICSSTRANLGFGTGFKLNNVFSVIKIWKVLE